jgi:DNA polymerase/3'-5' exonuclease PolX
MKYDEAIRIAEGVKAKLDVHCERIEIAGSVRRRKLEVGDIEIVAIPRSFIEAPDLLMPDSGVRRRSRGFALTVCGLGRIVKGNPREGKYIQIETRAADGPVIKIDLFTATAENWGLIYAIRTGSAQFSHSVLACGWVSHGYHSEGGMLRRKSGEVVAVPEERDLFRLAGVAWVEPEARL